MTKKSNSTDDKPLPLSQLWMPIDEARELVQEVTGKTPENTRLGPLWSGDFILSLMASTPNAEARIRAKATLFDGRSPE